jgi:hypothetical protein
MATVFWDCGRVILLDVMHRGTTFNSDTYVSTPKKMRKRFQCVRPDRNLRAVFLQHDYVRLYTSVKTREASTRFDGRCYHIHPTDPTYLLSLDFRLLAVCGKKFESDDDVVSAVGIWLLPKGKERHRSGMHSFRGGAKLQKCMESS